MVTSGLQNSPSVSRECKKVGTDVQKNQEPKALTTGEHSIWGGKGSRGRVRHGPGKINNCCEHPGEAREAGKPCLNKMARLQFPERVNPTATLAWQGRWCGLRISLLVEGPKEEGVPRTSALPPHCVTFKKKASILLNGLQLTTSSIFHT